MSLTILVTDAQTRAGLGAIRSLGRAGYRVVAGYPEGVARPPAAWSRHCAGEIRYPSPRRDPRRFSEWLLEQTRRGRFDVVFPVSEPALVRVAAIRKELPPDLVAVLPSDAALQYTLSKVLATRMALAAGIVCPRTVFVSDGGPAAVWNTDLSSLRFPIVIKTDNHLSEVGTYELGRTFGAQNAVEAQRILRDLAPLRTGILAQERIIPGTGAGAFLLRFGGKTRLRFAHRRLHEVPYTGGWSSYRESCHDDELIELGERLLDAIDYDGLAMVEFRRDADGRPYFLEINGRLWGSVALALHAGVDFPAELVRCYLDGEPLPEPPPYRSGVRCRNIYPGEISHVASILRRRRPGQPQRAPSLVGALVRFVALTLDPRIRHDHFWWSDPLPAVRQAAAMIKTALGFVRQRGRRALRRVREGRTLRRLRRQHQARSARQRYFDRPLQRIVFLCHGNIYRSAFAAAYWQHALARNARSAPVAISAGFHPRAGRTPAQWFADVARDHGVDMAGHGSRIASAADIQAADAIFVMDRSNYRRLIAEFPAARDRTYFLGLFADDGRTEIVDPHGKSLEEVRACCRQLVSALEGLMRRVSVS